MDAPLTYGEAGDAATDAVGATSACNGADTHTTDAAVGADIPANATRAERDAFFMKRALDQAERAGVIGEVPIGAVVVFETPGEPARVVAEAHNLRETTRDPAGHAELLAIRKAARELGVWRLSGCTVYVTLEPCVMCAGLMHQARVDRCVWGAPDPKAGALGTLYQINADQRLNHRFEVTGGVLEDECATLLREFFAARRRAAREREEDLPLDARELAGSSRSNAQGCETTKASAARNVAAFAASNAREMEGDER